MRIEMQFLPMQRRDLRRLDSQPIANHSWSMAKFVSLFWLLIPLASAHSQSPTSIQLGNALHESAPDVYVLPPPIRLVRCIRLDDPTEFKCSYEERKKKSVWIKMSMIVAIDGDYWVVIDSPLVRTGKTH